MKTSYPWALAVDGIKRIFMGLVLAAGVLLTQPVTAAGPTPIDLKSCSNFVILAGSGITFAGAVNSTTITGDIGTYPTLTINGLENVTLNGVNHVGDAVTQSAKNDLGDAYDAAIGRSPTTVYAAMDLGGLILTNGVYKDSSSFEITGTLTLDAQGNPDAVWIFQAGSTLITASNSKVALTNGAQACNVFWQVGSSATFGTGTDFAGNILALTDITLNTGAMVTGRVLARNGAVTFDSAIASLPTKAVATVTLNNLAQNYNGSARVVTATTAPTGLTVNITYDGNSWAPTNAGSYAVAATINDGYYLGSTNGVLVVSPLAVVLNGTRAYDATATALFDMPLTVTNYMGSDDVSVASGSATLAGANVGAQAISSMGTLALGGAAAANYTLTGASGSVTVGRATLAITASADSKIYGGTKTYGTGQTAFTSAGLQNGETIGSVTITASGGTTANAGVGAYDLTPSAAAGGTFTPGNYTITYNNGMLTVGAATLTITGPTKSRAYGAVNGDLAGAYSGQQNGETFTVTGSTTATTNSPVADYAIVPDVTGATLANYTVTPVNGTLTVGRATLAITASVDSKTYGVTKTYGAGQTAFTSAGLLNGETIGSVTIIANGGTAANAGVGAYDLTPSAAAGGTFTPGNYTITYNNGTLTVGAATLTITGPTKSRAYGAANGDLAGTYSGQQNGETFTVTGSTIATTNSPVADYAIVPDVTGATLANYTVTPVNGTLTVGRATLAITASADSKTYGGTKTYGAGQTAFTSAGLLNGETIGSVTITASGGTATNAGVGAYDLTPSAAAGGTFTPGNYSITYNNGVLTVGVATLTITGPTKSRAYGAANGDLAGAYSGQQNGETFAVTGSTTATTNSPVADYAIVPDVTGATLANYTVAPVNGTLTVNKADQAITNFTPINGSVFAVTNTIGLNATGGGSTNPVVFMVISGPGVISGMTNLTFTNTGTMSVTANQSGDTNWNVAPEVTNTYSFLPAAMLGQAITNFTPINGSEFEVTNKVGLSAQASSLLLVSFAVASGPGTITGGTNLDFTSTGLVSIVASQAGNTFYDAASNMTNTFTVIPPLLPEQTNGMADIAVSDMVYLPVNVTNLTTAGTVSFRLENFGPATLSSAEVVFDFRMGINDTNMVLIGSDQRAFNLVAGQESLIILTAQEKRNLVVPATLSGVKQVQVTVRHASTLYDPNPSNNTTTVARPVLVRASGVNSPARAFNDYDGDGKADIAIWRAGINLWAMCLSGQRYGFISELYAGNTGDMPAPGDYDDDGLTDIAVYCHLNGWWNVLLSSNEQIVKTYFIGGPGFTAAQCDFDGDFKTDPMVYREADGYWLGAASSRQYALCDTSLGETGYQSVVADYDGDGLADPAIYNRTTGLWAISLSGRGYKPLVTGTFGGSGYLPATADYDGDGLADPAIYDYGTAHLQVLFSGSLATMGYYTWCGVFLGSVGGLPIPADYDGDGLADPAVYHQDTSRWELFLSTQGYQLVWGLFGGPEYQPVTE